MRAAAMTLPAAASGFIVLLLTSPVVNGDWRVSYTFTQICALKGSTVDMYCPYEHQAEKAFWYTKESNNVFVDLRTDPDYSGRVQYRCRDNYCTLTISNLRESDSAVYYCSQQGETYITSPGVTLSVAALQVKVRKVLEYIPPYASSRMVALECHSSCPLPGRPSYVWFMNGQKMNSQTSNTCLVNIIYQSSRYSCAVKGHENFPSPSLSFLGENGWGVTYTSTKVCALKGSTVDFGCTFRYPYRRTPITVQETFWIREKYPKSVDLRPVSDYMNHDQYNCDMNKCSLRISNLTESNSAVYKFRFETNLLTGKYTGAPGVSLSVTDPQLQIHVRRSTVNEYSTWTELTCHNMCPLPHQYSYIWYKNGHKVQNKKVYFHPHPLNPADNYTCAVQGYEMFPSPPVYAPRLPSVSVSPSAEIMEGSLVNLTCSSDANPAASYTWFKENQTLISEDPQLVFSSIQSSDSGEYHCEAENQLGRRTTENIRVDVRYAPKTSSLSVSPSAEIVEGSPVTLTCSSDANPAASYTWFKEKQTMYEGPKGKCHFPSISSEDRGNYYCKSENQHGEINSKSIFLDVQYPPRLPSVSVSPSAEIVEGSSVTLTCSSDANPAASYTWFKDDEDSPRASGPIFNITEFTAEHSGDYHCEAQNGRGSRKKTTRLSVVSAWKSAAIGTSLGLFLAIIFLFVFLLIMKNRASKQTSEPENRPDNREQSEESADVHYASVRFAKNQTDCVYSNIRPAGCYIHEEEEVEYAAVKFNSARRTVRTRDQGTVDDPDVLYSAVNRHNRNR